MVAFSICPDDEVGLIIYLDQSHGSKSSTSDFLLAAPERDIICGHLQRLFEQRVPGRTLVERPWNPDHGPESVLSTLLAGGSVRKNSVLSTERGSGDDMVGLNRHPKVQKILEGEELVLSAMVFKQAKGKRPAGRGSMQNRVLAVTRTSIRDLDTSKYSMKHRLPLVELLTYSVSHDGEGFLLNALVKGVHKEFVFSSEHRDRICESVCKSYQHATGNTLRKVGWPATGLGPLTPVEEATDVSVIAEDENDAASVDEMVEDDLIDLMHHPKREGVLKGDELHAAVEVSKVSKSSKLDRRYLVLTDSCMCDVNHSSMKPIHRVEFNRVVGFSVCPDDEISLIIYLDQTEKKSTPDFLLVAPERGIICGHLQRLFEQRVPGRSLVESPWNAHHGPERTLTALLGGVSVTKMEFDGGSGDDLVGLNSHPKIQKLLEGEELVLSAQVSKLGKGKLGKAGKDSMQNRVLAVTNASVRDLDPSSYGTKHRIPLIELLSYSVSNQGFLLKTRGASKEFVFASEHSTRICECVCDVYQKQTGQPLRSVGWPSSLDVGSVTSAREDLLSGARNALAEGAQRDESLEDDWEVDSVESAALSEPVSLSQMDERYGTAIDDAEPEPEDADDSPARVRRAKPGPDSPFSVITPRRAVVTVPVYDTREEVMQAIQLVEVRHHALLEGIDDILDMLKLRCDGSCGMCANTGSSFPHSFGWPDAALHQMAFSTGPAVLGEFMDMSEMVLDGLQSASSVSQIGDAYMRPELEPYVRDYAENCASLRLVANELRAVQRDHPQVKAFLATQFEDAVQTGEMPGPWTSTSPRPLDFGAALDAPAMHLDAVLGLVDQLRGSTEPQHPDHQRMWDAYDRLIEARGGDTGLTRASALDQSIVAATTLSPIRPDRVAVDCSPYGDSRSEALTVVYTGEDRELLHEHALATLSKSRHDYTTALAEAPPPPEMIMMEEHHEELQLVEQRHQEELRLVEQRFAADKLKLETDLTGLRVELAAAESRKQEDEKAIASYRQRLEKMAVEATAAAYEVPEPLPPPPPVVREGELSAEQQEAVVLQLRELERQLEATHTEMSDVKAENRRQTARTSGLQQQLRNALGCEEEEDEADLPDTPEEAAVAEELKGLKMSALRAHAISVGVEQDVLDAADDSGDPQETLVQTLLKMHAEQAAAEEEHRLEDVGALQRALQERTEAQEALQANFEKASTEFSSCVERCCNEVAVAELAQRQAEARAEGVEDEARRLLGEAGYGVLPLTERNALRRLFDAATESARVHRNVSAVVSTSPSKPGGARESSPVTGLNAGEGRENVLGRKQMGELLGQLQLVDSEARADEIFSQLWREAGVGWESLVGCVEAGCSMEGTSLIALRIHTAAENLMPGH